MVLLKVVGNSGLILGREAERTRFNRHDPLSQFLLRIAAGVVVAGLLRKEKTID